MGRYGALLDREIAVAALLVREAGAVLLEVYRTDFSVELKDCSDPLTEADKRANALLVSRLRAEFPGDGVVAEESPDQSDALRLGRCWYVDPLDGTKEFVARNGEFSVMLGLAINGAAALGAVYQPTTDKLYGGVVGGGAFLEHVGLTRPLLVGSESDPRSLRLVVSRSHRSGSTDRIKERLGIHHEAATGSVGLKVGLIAEQAADLYVHPSDRSSAWDACGPEAILRAAGGRFTDCAGRAFVYGGNDMRNRGGILACNAAAFDAVLPIVHDVCRGTGLVE